MLLNKYFFKILRLTERASAYFLGKGYGAATINREVKAVLSFLPPPTHTTPVI